MLRRPSCTVTDGNAGETGAYRIVFNHIYSIREQRYTTVICL
jgi:hypothetical protein